MMRFALAIALTASCGGSAEPAPAPPPTEAAPSPADEPALSVPAPWSAWDLPVGGATLDSADDKELHLLYDHGKPKDRFEHWTSEMKEGGWKILEPFVFKGIYSTTFIKGPEKLEIIVGGRTDAVDVLLTIGD